MTWIAVALVIVAVAAAVLVWILLEARGIARHAGRALAAVRKVRERTGTLGAIPGLAGTLDRAVGDVRAITGHAAALGDALPGEKEGPA